MEPIRACLNEEWESSLSGVFSNFEADQFMAHLYDANNEYSNTFRNNGMISSNFLSIDETSMNINDIGGVNLYNFANSLPNSQKIYEENSYSSGSNSPFFPTQGYENNHFFSETNQMTVSCNNTYEHRNIFSEGFLVPNFPRVMEENFITKTELVNHENPENDFHQSSTTVYSGEELKLKRKYHVQEHETSGDGKMNELVESPKKKPRLPRDAHKVKRNALSKKNKKNSLDGTDDEEKSGTKDVQDHPNSCNSEDDNSNIASQDFKGKANTALNSSGKTRACRGAATDPQSLYARKRRERINERLRILQNLVPNGTKVDISTMLEEAVQYVKFLQLQIKLLSSDEMWMFAPIAYNGMDMGLYDKLSM